MNRRLTNAAYTLATTDQLWEGEIALTGQEYVEMKWVEQEYLEEQRISREYGDCGRSIVGTGDYEQMAAEEAREHFYGIPNPLLY